MANCFTTTHSRAPNSVDAQSASETSSDGLRRVTFRNVKGPSRDGVYQIVRVATLKRREGGRWVIVASGRSVDAGRAFLLGA